jgi:hypothetical protein
MTNKKTDLAKAIRAYELLPKSTYIFEVKTSSGLTKGELADFSRNLWKETSVIVHFIMTDNKDFSIQALPAEEGKET